MKKGNTYIYDNKTDVLWIKVKSGVEEYNREVVPGFLVEYGKDNSIIGIEIQKFSRFFKLVPTSRYTDSSSQNTILSGGSPLNSNQFTYNFISN